MKKWGIKLKKRLEKIFFPRRRFIQNVFATGIGLLIGSKFFPRLSGQLRADQREFDVVVIGSGAAGMTAGLRAVSRGLKVLILEKAEKFGGSTARSGGGIWIRNNSVNVASGVNDTPEAAADYLAAVVGEQVPLANQTAFLRNGPFMLDFVMANSPLRFRWMPGYSDYFPQFSGAQVQGASVEPQALDRNLLGKEKLDLAPPYIPTPQGVVIYGADYKWLTLAKVTLKGAAKAAQSVSRYFRSVVRGQQPLTMGQALAAGLRVGLIRRNVPMWLNTPLTSLLTSPSGKVTGVKVLKEGIEISLYARRGVILATGGFEHNLFMRQKYLNFAQTTEWSLGATSNTGDGVIVGKSVEASLKLMDEAWWGPCVPLDSGPYFCLSERSLPGSMMINQDGERFVNESAPYHVVVKAMVKQQDVESIWLVIDQGYRNRYLFKDVLPGLPLPKKWFQSGVIFRAPKLDGLADMIKVPKAQLQAAVERFNQFAAEGVDEDFNRGNNSFDNYYSDPGFKPNPNLGAIRQGPFYAIKLVPGDLGTKGGLQTDENAQVLNKDGAVVSGLYAAGNTSASVMGRSYAGAGATLGPAMTFGYIAADHIADQDQAIGVNTP